MKITQRVWAPQRVLQIAVFNAILFELALGSVLPRPNVKQSSTTQIANLDKNYLGDETIVIVTSSELPKQIPPPPTPTKPQRPTPRYDVTPKELLYRNEAHNKGSFVPFRVPYSLGNANALHGLA